MAMKFKTSGPKGPKGPSGPKKRPGGKRKAPNQGAENARKKAEAEKARKKAGEALKNSSGKGSEKGGKTGTRPETRMNTVKGFGCFMNQVKNNPILRKQIIYLDFAIMVIETFMEEDQNPAALEVMGIDRKEIVSMLQEVLGQYNDSFKKSANIERIGDFLKRNDGNPAKLLFGDVMRLTEDHDEGAIAIMLNEFDQAVSRIPFFQIPDAMLEKYKEVLKAIMADNTMDPQKREVIARNILKVYRGYSPKWAIAGNAPAPNPTPTTPTQPAPAPAPIPTVPTPPAATPPTAPAPTLSAEEKAAIQAEARAKIQAEFETKRKAEEQARKQAEAAERARQEAEAQQRAAEEQVRREAEEKVRKEVEAKRKAAEEQASEPEPIAEPTPEIDEAEIETLKEALEVTATAAPKILDLYELCEAINQTETSSPLGNRLARCNEGGPLFTRFMVLDEFNPERINDYLIRILVSMGRTPTTDSIVDDLEELYDTIYPEYTQAKKEAEDDTLAQIDEAIAEAEAIKKQAEEAARQKAEAVERVRKEAEEAERARIEAEERAKAEAKVAEAAGIVSATGGPRVVSAPTSPPPPPYTPTTEPVAKPQAPNLAPAPMPVPEPPKPLTKSEKMLADMAEAIDKSNIKCAYMLDLAKALIQAADNESLRDRLLALNHPFVSRFLDQDCKFNDSNFMSHLMVAVNKSAPRGKFVSAKTINQHLSAIYDELNPSLEGFQEELKKLSQNNGGEPDMVDDDDVVDVDLDDVVIDSDGDDTVVGPPADPGGNDK